MTLRTDEIKAIIQFSRRQVLAAIQHWHTTGKSVEQLEFRVRTMRLSPPSDSARDDARIMQIEQGLDAKDRNHV